MNLLALSGVFASFLAFASANGEFVESEGCPFSDSTSIDCSSSSSISSCSSSSSSYFDSRSRCTRALEEVLAHPNIVAYPYFAPMEREVRIQSGLFLNPSTRSTVAENLSTRYGILVYISDALGQFIRMPVPIDITTDQFPSTSRSWALNEGVAVRAGNGQVWYSFPIFDRFGAMLTISLVQETANMPLNQICYRQVRKF